MHAAEDQAVGQQQRHREGDAHPALPEPQRHVVRRAAAVLPVCVAHLVQLREGALGVGRRHPDDRGAPHPEQRPRPAHAQRDRHPGQVAGAHARGEAGAERLERRDTGVVAVGAPPDHMQHVRQAADLQETQPQGEEHADAQQAVDQHVVPQHAVDQAHDRRQGRLHQLHQEVHRRPQAEST